MAANQYWMVVVSALWLTSIMAGCAKKEPHPPFDPKTCMKQIPDNMVGLSILVGPRTKKSIISDMRESECNAQVLHRQMRSTAKLGKIVFEISVEYTGETSRVDIIESTVSSQVFEREVSDFIMDSDFKPWTRHDDAAVFRYTMHFDS